jgi:hypothetical protein
MREGPANGIGCPGMPASTTERASHDLAPSSAILHGQSLAHEMEPVAVGSLR